MYVCDSFRDCETNITRIRASRSVGLIAERADNKSVVGGLVGLPVLRLRVNRNALMHDADTGSGEEAEKYRIPRGSARNLT